MAGVKLYHTTIGKKIVMALTGLIWVGYVVMHMFGNLKVFAGPGSETGTINAWGIFLRAFGQDVLGHAGVLWLVRGVLVVALALHVVTAYQLSRLDNASRPVAYHGRHYVRTGIAARSMRWGGLFILLFVVYHIAHMTLGVPSVHPSFEDGDIYHNLITGLGSPLAAAIYTLAMVVLALHLYHGTWSMFQTLGFDAFERTSAIRRAGQLLAVAVAGGFMLVPIAIVLGVLR